MARSKGQLGILHLDVTRKRKSPGNTWISPKVSGRIKGLKISCSGSVFTGNFDTGLGDCANDFIPSIDATMKFTFVEMIEPP